MLFPLALQWWYTLQHMGLLNHLLMQSLGYEWRLPVYGRVLFAEGEWVKRRG